MTFPVLLATTFRCFDACMTRRTYRLPSAIDQALARHAKAQGVSSSVIVRDALSAYLLIEGAAQRASMDMETVRAGQQACLLLLEQIWEQIRGGRQDAARPINDRVQARFAYLTEETHGRRND